MSIRAKLEAAYGKEKFVPSDNVTKAAVVGAAMVAVVAQLVKAKGLKSADVAKVSAADVEAVTEAEIDALTAAEMGTVTLSLLKAVPPSVLHAKNVEELIKKVKPAQINGIKPGLLEALTVDQVASMSPEQMNAVEARQLAAVDAVVKEKLFLIYLEGMQLEHLKKGRADQAIEIALFIEDVKAQKAKPAPGVAPAAPKPVKDF